MKRWMIGALLGAVGCASGANREEFDQLKKKVAELEQTQEAHNAKQARLYEDLVAKHDLIQKRLVDTDAVVKIMETTMKRIEERLRGAAPPNGGGGGTNVTPADAAARTSEALLGLKTGKVDIEEVVVGLKPIAKEAAPLLMEELRKSATDAKYANQLIVVLSNLPPEAVRLPVSRALEEKSVVRILSARIVGNLKDRETSKILEKHVETDDEDFRLVLGESLAACRNPAGIPLLVRSLRSEEFTTRVIALETLRRLNQGEDFGFRASRPEANKTAIQKWEEWAATRGKTIFD